jgi:hypothetical protein
VIIIECIAAAVIGLAVEIAGTIALVAFVFLLCVLADLIDWPRPR